MGEFYDPYNDRRMVVALTDKAAIVFLLKGSLGTGLLSMPMNYSKLGYLNGAFWTVLVGIIFVACTHSLINNFHILKHRYNVSSVHYAEAMKMALEDGPPCLQSLSNGFKLMTNIYLWMLHFGICCVYVIFVSDNIRQVIASITIIDVDSRIFMFCLLPFLILTFLRPHLRGLVHFIVMANASLTFGFIFLVPYLVTDLPPLEERESYKDLSFFPHFYGTLLFSVNSVGLFLTVERYMRYPENFGGWNGILNRVMCFVIPLNVAMGFVGYWRFGDELQSSITLALPQNDLYAIFIKGFFALAVFFSYTLQGYVCVDLISYHFLRDETDRALEILFRVVFVLTTVLLDMIFSQLQIVIALVGVTMVSSLGIVFPGILDLCVRYPFGFGAYYKWLFIDIILIVVGTTISVIGTFQCLMDVVRVYTT